MLSILCLSFLPCIITLYYIKNQQYTTLAVLFISHCKITFGRFLRPSSGVLKTATGVCHGSGLYISSKDVRGRLPLHCVIAYLGQIGYDSAVATDLGYPYWIYIIPTHGMLQWLLLQFLVLLMMDAESVRNM